MVDSEKRKRFVELRCGGMSYVKISKEIGVSKSTVVRWSREYRNEIQNAKTLELEALREEYHLGREHRLRLLGTQLSRLTKEMLKRDLSEVPTWRIYDMLRKVIAEIAKDDESVEFSLDMESNYSTMLKDLETKTVKWTG